MEGARLGTASHKEQFQNSGFDLDLPPTAENEISYYYASNFVIVCGFGVGSWVGLRQTKEGSSLVRRSLEAFCPATSLGQDDPPTILLVTFGRERVFVLII